MFHPGETETFKFTIPIAADRISKLIVSFGQYGREIFSAEITSFTVEGDESCSATYTMTEEESLSFDEYAALETQLNIICENDERFASVLFDIESGEQLHYDSETNVTVEETTATDSNAVHYTADSKTSAEKAVARTNIGAGTYSLPSGGIPKTDLASAVQTSLGKADTALQATLVATSSTLGMVKIGSGVSVANDGTLSAVGNNLKKYGSSDDFAVLLAAALTAGDKVIDITGDYTLSSMITISGKSDITLSGIANIKLLNDFNYAGSSISGSHPLWIYNSSNIHIDGMVFDCNSKSIANGVFIQESNNVSIENLTIKNVLALDYDSETSTAMDTCCVYTYGNNIRFGTITLNNIISKTGGTIGATGALTGVFVKTDSTHKVFDCETINASTLYNKVYSSTEADWVRTIRDADVVKTRYAGDIYPEEGRINSGIHIGCISALNCDKRWAKLQSGGVTIDSIVGDNKDSTVYGNSVVSIFCDNVVIGNINVWAKVVSAIEVTAGAKNVTIHDSNIQGKFTWNGIYCSSGTVTSQYDGKISLVLENVTMVNENESDDNNSMMPIQLGGDGKFVFRGCTFDYKKAQRMVYTNTSTTVMDKITLDGCRFACDKLTTAIMGIGSGISGMKTVIKDCIFDCVMNRTEAGQYVQFFNTIDATRGGNEVEIDGLEFKIKDVGSSSCSQVMQSTAPIKISRYKLNVDTTGSTTPDTNMRISASTCDLRDIEDSGFPSTVIVSSSAYLENTKTGTITVQAASGIATAPTATLLNCADYEISSGVTANIIQAYTLPQATASVLGGIKAEPRGEYDNAEVKIDAATGKLYAPVHVSDVYTLTIGCTTNDSVTVTGQTVTVRKGLTASSPVYTTFVYNGTAVSIKYPKDSAYYVEVTDTLGDHYSPSTASGTLSADASVTLTYKDASDVTSFAELQTAVACAAMTEEALVGKEIADTFTYSASSAYSNPMVVMAVQTVEDEDGNEHRAAMCQRKYAHSFGIQFDAPEAVVATETTAQSGVVYYGYNGSTYTDLDTLEEGDPLPTSEYTTIYKNAYHSNAAHSSGAIVTLGCNRYKESAVRQLLNSSAAAGSWWQAQHVGDCEPTQHSTVKGYKACCSSELLAAVKAIKIQCVVNANIYGVSTDTMYDDFWLPSGIEMYGTYNAGEGTYFPKWKTATGLSSPSNDANSGRVIYKEDATTSARVFWLRSSDTVSMLCHTVGNNGQIYGPGANVSNCICPCCAIY